MTTTVSQAVAKREAGLDKMMWAKGNHFKTILPDHIDVKSFIGTAWAALLASDQLMKCAAAKPDTLLTALYRCAALGHQPGTDEFYLTPRNGGILGIEGYRGIVERMYRSGAVASVIVREVCAKDYFRYVEGEDERPVHKFAARDGTTGADFFGDKGTVDRGLMVGVYAVAKLTNGAWSRPAILSRDDVLAARDAGGYKPGDQYTPWNRLDAGKDHPEFRGRSMWWKTAARRLEPWVPTSAEYRREALRAAARATGGGAPAPDPSAHAMNGAPPEGEIHDAEIVEEASPVLPAGEHAAVEDAGPPVPAGGGSPAPATPEPQTGAGPSLRGLEGYIRGHFKRLGYDDADPAQKEERLVFTARLSGRDDYVTKGELTREQALAVAEALDRCADRAALVALVTDGEVPS